MSKFNQLSIQHIRDLKLLHFASLKYMSCDCREVDELQRELGKFIDCNLPTSDSVRYMHMFSFLVLVVVQ